MDDQSDAPVNVNWETDPLPNSVDENHSYWAVEKIYISAEPRVGTTAWRIGFNIIPPPGTQVLVAISTDGMRKYPKNTSALTEEAFQNVLHVYTKAVLNEIDKLNAPKEGF